MHIFAASWVYFFAVVYPAVLIGRLRRKRVVLNYRGGDAKRFLRVYGWVAKPVFRMVDVITAPSNFLAQIITNFSQLPVRIVPNIVDLSAFRFRKRVPLRPKLLVTRHLEKIYDIPSVLRAFRRIQEQIPEASLWIAGNGSQRESLEGLVAAWHLRNVRFLGHVAHEDLPTILDDFDIVLNASLVDNFPGALLEASAAGLAIVSSCAGGIPFIYENGKHAVLVEPGNWEGLAVGVIELLQSPSRAAEMTKEAALVAATYEWKRVRPLLYEAYDFLLGDDQRTAFEHRACTATARGL
jgi:glycosyltransferase involved in cell wall biosynthesis